MFEAGSLAEIILRQKEARVKSAPYTQSRKGAGAACSCALSARGVKGEHMIYDLNTLAIREIKVSDYRENSNAGDIRTLGALTGLAGGTLAALLGSTLTAVSWFAEVDSIVKTLGTVLLVFTIPLLICGAHCLDLMETKRRA